MYACVRRRQDGDGDGDSDTLNDSSASGDLGRLLYAPSADPPSAPRPVQDPEFPHLPASVPLTFTLAMAACLSERPADRPTFAQLGTIFSDLCSEVARGYYINSAGMLQVSPPFPPPPQMFTFEKRQSILREMQTFYTHT